MEFTATTYNVLASAYIRPSYFPDVAAELLDPERRRRSIARQAARLDADILCMQEVEVETFEAVEQELSASGYVGSLALKGGGKPDGCALFVRSSAFELVRVARLQYDDRCPGMPESGHVGQLAVLRSDGFFVGIANTHLKWQPPGTPPENRYDLRQISQLLGVRLQHAPECRSWIVCGDFNVTSEDEVIRELLDAGFASTHIALGGATCNPNRRAKMIDYLFHDESLASTAIPLFPVTDTTPLPSPEQPSDHVAVTARFRRIGEVARVNAWSR